MELSYVGPAVTAESLEGTSSESNETMAQKIQTLLVDDSPIFLGSLRRFVEAHPGVAVIGTAASGREAIDQVARLRPDLVLLDLIMPQMNGLEALRRIRALPVSPLVVVLTLQNEPEFRSAAESEGADGFVTKAEMGQRLLPLIDALFPPTPDRPTKA